MTLPFTSDEFFDVLAAYNQRLWPYALGLWLVTLCAVIAMIRGIAVEYARYGVRANAILPGWIRTDMTATLVSWDKFNEKAIGRVPMRRWGEPEDFAGIAVYLASDASRYHTGDSFVIDGGYTIF